MSSEEPNNMSNYVVNPFTNRLIKKGSKTHKRLVSARLLDETPPKRTDSNVVLEANDPSEAKVITTKMTKGALGRNKVITRRNNKVLKAQRRPTRQETIDKVSDIAVDSIVECKDEILSQDMTDEEMDEYIRRMIQLKLIGGKPRPNVKTRVSSVQEPEVYDDDSDYSQ